MPDNNEAVPLDGRLARSERMKQAIIDAAVALVQEGNLIPSAQQIADRAGVGHRSLFRHFEDMETLFAATEDQQRGENEEVVFGGDHDGTLESRINDLIARRVDAYEQNRNIVLSTLAQLWRSKTLRKNYAKYQRESRKDLDERFPELKQLPRAHREAANAMVSFEMWHRLREHQRLSRDAATEVIYTQLLSILDY